MKTIKMILTAVSFLRDDEPQEPYGISCLVDAFNSGNLFPLLISSKKVSSEILAHVPASALYMQCT